MKSPVLNITVYVFGRYRLTYGCLFLLLRYNKLKVKNLIVL